MRRSPILLLSAALSLPILGVIGWMKWSESASPRRLKAEIQKDVYRSLELALTDLKPTDIQVDISSTRYEAQSSYYVVEGTLTIPGALSPFSTPKPKRRTPSGPRARSPRSSPPTPSCEAKKSPPPAGWVPAVPPGAARLRSSTSTKPPHLTSLRT